MNKTTNKTKLIIALDLESKDENLALCQNLSKHNLKDCYLKIGLRSFIRDGIDFIQTLQNLGFKIFLDLKLYDIPNTMLDSIKEIAKLNISIITIHASSGRKAMESIMRYLKTINNPPLVFAVSALTSFDNDEFREIYHQDINKAVLNFAIMAGECGIDGVVCSPLESGFIKDSLCNLLTLTPAIRPNSKDFNNKLSLDESHDDQQRTASIDTALREKSDFIVIGRPIYKSKNPILLTQAIINKLKES